MLGYSLHTEQPKRVIKMANFVHLEDKLRILVTIKQKWYFLLGKYLLFFFFWEKLKHQYNRSTKMLLAPWRMGILTKWCFMNNFNGVKTRYLCFAFVVWFMFKQYRINKTLKTKTLLKLEWKRFVTPLRGNCLWNFFQSNKFGSKENNTVNRNFGIKFFFFVFKMIFWFEFFFFFFFLGPNNFWTWKHFWVKILVVSKNFWFHNIVWFHKIVWFQKLFNSKNV